MSVIDADAHVIESPQTWSYMREDEQEFRPQIFVRDPKDGAPYRKGQRHQYWLIEGKVQSKGSNVGGDVPTEAATLADVKRRLDHMDQVGIDVQVLFPSLFLRPLTTNHDVEFALVRSYNRWLADTWSKSNNRLRWVAAPPILSLVDTGKVRAELEFCKANGACGIFMRGIESDMPLSHRHFYPLFEMAQDLDLAICLHAGVNSASYHDMFVGQSSLMTFKFPVVGAFSTLLEQEIPKRFPNVRWAFVEASAQWVPYILNQVKMQLARKGVRADDRLMTSNNFYVTTQRSDDLRWLLTELGDDNLIVGTDYGHRDDTAEVDALKRMSEDGDMPRVSIDKILKANPGRLYGIG
jgi:predicted TIM-barrel fold metal-dependent hydrolase